jgi:glycosyltransferase involved in cell wall biosynthesis
MIPARGARMVTIHDLYFLNAGGTAPEIRRDYPDLAENHARRADGIVVPSEYTKLQVTSLLGVDPAKVTVCSPGAPAWPRREEPAIPGPILFVGTIERRKNVPGLVRAYAELIGRRPDAPDLVLAGRMVLDAAESGLHRWSGAAARVRMLGYVTDAQRQQLYREASMLVMPSFDEGFGIPALEAMTVGLPVVAARRGALPEVVGDAGVLVDPDDTAALAAAMERVLTEPHSRRRMADDGVSRARQFNWDGSAVRLRQAYDAAVLRRRLA